MINRNCKQQISAWSSTEISRRFREHDLTESIRSEYWSNHDENELVQLI